jgi:uncharacterized membrane protein YccF (DUF307 family)
MATRVLVRSSETAVIDARSLSDVERSSRPLGIVQDWRDQMRLLGNILWLVLAGLWLGLSYLFAGILNCLTIIGIPFGIQSFKLAGYAFWPFGRVVIERPNADRALGCLGNGLWLIFGGLWLALFQVVLGLVFFLTILGIPFGIGSFRMAGLALWPFGKMVVREDEVPYGARIIIGPLRQLQ